MTNIATASLSVIWTTVTITKTKELRENYASDIDQSKNQN